MCAFRVVLAVEQRIDGSRTINVLKDHFIFESAVPSNANPTLPRNLLACRVQVCNEEIGRLRLWRGKVATGAETAAHRFGTGKRFFCASVSAVHVSVAFVDGVCGAVG